MQSTLNKTEFTQDSCSASRFARRNHGEKRVRPVRDAIIIAFQLVLLSVVCLFLYNGIEQLKHSKNHHELIKRQRLLRAHQLLKQFDSNQDRKLSDAELNFASLNSYQY